MEKPKLKIVDANWVELRQTELPKEKLPVITWVFMLSMAVVWWIGVFTVFYWCSLVIGEIF